MDVEGERGGFAAVERATSNLGSAIEGAEVIAGDRSGPSEELDPAGISNSMNVRLIEAEIHLVAVPLRVPTDKNSVPTDSGAFRSSASRPPRPASGPALGGLIHKLTL